MNFDSKAFYSERVRRLSVPDEDPEEYMHRIKASSGISLSSNQPLPIRFQCGNVGTSSSEQDVVIEAGKRREYLQSDLPGQDLSHEFGPLFSSPTTSVMQGMIGAKETGSGRCKDAYPHVPQPLLEAQDISAHHSPGDVEDGDAIGKVATGTESQLYTDTLGYRHDSLPPVNNVIPELRHETQIQTVQPRKTGNAKERTCLTPPVHASDEMASPPTSPIEDASEMREQEPNLKDNKSNSVHKAVRGRLKSWEKDHAVSKHVKFIKLGSKVNPIRVAREFRLGKESSDGDDSSIIVDPSSRPSSPPLDAATLAGTSAVVVKSTGTSKSTAGKVGKRAMGKKGKEKIKRMLPEEYAKLLMDKSRADLHSAVRKKYIQSLAGMNIYYTGGDMHFATERTRSRMEIIVRHGANLIPTFESSVVTHIVTDAQKNPTLRALNLKSLDEIPNHIPTVKWSWVVSGIGRGLRNTEGITMDEVWLHAAFSDRIAGPSWEHPRLLKGKTGDNHLDTNNLNHISRSKRDPTVGIDDISDISSAPLLSSNFREAADAQNSLEMFYEKAKAEIESERYNSPADGDLGQESDHSRSGPPTKISLPKRGWTCDKQEGKTSCPNQDIIDKLQELLDIHKSRLSDEDKWRAYSYSKCIRTLSKYPHRIETLSEARSIPGVGEKTALKIMEIVETGQLRRIAFENTDDIKITRLFQGIYGVGPAVAYRWYAAGCRTLEDLVAGRYGVKLHSAQEIGVKFYNDINSRMPREEAKAIFELIKPVALQLDQKLYVEIMGSFRRGKKDCGDIDILITRPTDDGKTHAGILGSLLRNLHAAGILTEDLALPEDPTDLEAIYRGLCRLPGENSVHRRIDFLTVPWQSRGAALLYYTGDDIFNRAMRLKANVMGYSLNQRGLFAGVVRDPHDRRIKTNPGQLVASETEGEIFRILNVPWQEPHERARG